MDKRYIRLNLGNDHYDYFYYPKTKTVCTTFFPDIPVYRVFLGCGHFIGHDTLVEIIEEKQKVLEELANLF